MNYIIIIFCSIILPIISLKEIKPKFCFNCKYFITDNNTGKFGKCSLFTKEEKNIYMLVNGISEDKNIEYHYCCVSRETEHMCGKEGKMYKKKYIRKLK